MLLLMHAMDVLSEPVPSLMKLLGPPQVILGLKPHVLLTRSTATVFPTAWKDTVLQMHYKFSAL